MCKWAYRSSRKERLVADCTAQLATLCALCAARYLRQLRWPPSAPSLSRNAPLLQRSARLRCRASSSPHIERMHAMLLPPPLQFRVLEQPVPDVRPSSLGIFCLERRTKREIEVGGPALCV